jgi:hypothetical protein
MGSHRNYFLGHNLYHCNIYEGREEDYEEDYEEYTEHEAGTAECEVIFCRRVERK